MHIWIIEDSPSDVLLIELCLMRAGIGYTADKIADGERAVKRIREAADGEVAMPDLIMLDFNLPRVEGSGVIDALRKAPELAMVPVITMTSSSLARAIPAMTGLGPHRHVHKASELHAFMDGMSRAVIDLTARRQMTA